MAQRGAGSIDMVPANTLAEKEEYEVLGVLGDQEIPTIVLNKEYAPFKAYISTRAKDLQEKGCIGSARPLCRGSRVRLAALG